MINNIFQFQIKPFKIYLTKTTKIQIFKRFYPGKDKIITIASKTMLGKSPIPPNVKPLHEVLGVKKEISDANSLYNTIPGLPVLVYKSSKLKEQIQQNYILKKHLPLYEKNGVYVPYVVETFPTHGISGTFTLSPVERDFLLNNNNDVFKQSMGFLMARYAIIMYGGPQVQNVSDIRRRMQDLFSKDDNEAYKYSYPSNHIHGIRAVFPITQHHLALDMYGLKVPVNELSYPSKFNIPTQAITLQRDLEIFSISKSHDFLNDLIIVIDINNPSHRLLIQTNQVTLGKVSKQSEVDAIGSHTVFGTNDKVFYPIDTKIIGQLHNLNNKFNDNDLKNPYMQLSLITSDYKKGKITKEVFNLRFQQWTQDFFQNQVKNNKFIYDKYSTLPSIITDAHDLSDQHHYSTIKKTNPQLLENMIKDFSKMPHLADYFPTMIDYKKYDVYTTQLPFMMILKKYGMIDNYYSYRKLLLLLQDVHDC